MKSETLNLTRIRNDVNGNGRYVAHFLQLNTQEELDAVPWLTIDEKYKLAVKRSHAIGGRRFHNRQFGGGIVFKSCSPNELVECFSRLTGRKFYRVEIA